jgi:hypothetical protein
VAESADKLKVSWSGFDQTLRIHLEIRRIPCSAHPLYFPSTAQEGKVHTYAKLLRKQAGLLLAAPASRGRSLNLICPADLADLSRPVPMLLMQIFLIGNSHQIRVFRQAAQRRCAFPL